MSQLNKCKITAPTQEQCGDKASDCLTCPFRCNCDYPWIAELWRYDDKSNHGHGLLGPPWPGVIKADINNSHTWTFGNDKDNFVVYNINKKKKRIVIADIYVAESARGNGYAKAILNELLTTVVKDQELGNGYYIFAKAVKGTSAEEFWSHVATRIRATENNDGTDPNDWYEHPPMKDHKIRRDLAWFAIGYKEQAQDNLCKADLW